MASTTPPTPTTGTCWRSVCDPRLQGRGLGSLLLAHTLAQLDEPGRPGLPRGHEPRSRVLYERFGFEVVGEFAADGGPPMWPMWREPTPA
jgi:GNAT superfamily N-acetyltransferase